MRFAAYEHQHQHQHQHQNQGAVGEEDGTLSPIPGAWSLTDLIRCGDGLDALLDLGVATLDAPAGPHVSQVRLLPPLQPPTVRDFVRTRERP